MTRQLERNGRFGWRPVLIAAVLPLAGCNALRIPIDRGQRDPVTPPAAAKTAAASGESPPGKYPVRVSQFVFHADIELPRDLPLYRELEQLRDQVGKELQLPPANTLIQVYLFDDKDRYERFMRARYPDLPRRRAFFVAQPRGMGGGDDLFVYTFWGEHVRQDLRHELTHALLHSVLKDVPLWLDEGLAEFFELPPEAKGVNAQHLDLLRRETFKPDLTRLELLAQVDQMKPAEYREAWAWVHLLLRGKPEARMALLGYLQQLRSSAAPGPIQPRLKPLFGDLNNALVHHLARLDGPAVPDPTARR